MKKVLPFSEVSNNLPSVAVFADNRNGVLSQMQSVAVPYQSNGRTIVTVKDLAGLSHRDPLDALGIATQQMHDCMEVYKKSGFATAFARAVSKK